MPYHVSDGALDAFNIYLEQSGIPIAEFPAATTILATGLAASLFVLQASYYHGVKEHTWVVHDFVRKFGKSPRELEVLGDGNQAMTRCRLDSFSFASAPADS